MAPKVLKALKDRLDVTKGDMSAFIMAMKGAVDSGNAMKAQAFEHYKSLGRFSKEKADIVKAWKQDKTMDWWTTYTETKLTSNSVKTNAVAGHGSRLGMMSENFGV